MPCPPRMRTLVRLFCAATFAIVVCLALGSCGEDQKIRVGFIYDNDESTPYSYDFYLAQEALQETYGDSILIIMYSNVLDEDIATPVEKLSEQGCDIIFTNNYGDFISLAKEYPEIQFCQVSNNPYAGENPTNYHTFKGEAYQGRYVSGVVAGLKLQQMINAGTIKPNEALVGFVAAHPYPEVISGYSAFILGVRSVVDTATLRVKYTNMWNNYTMEKECAKELLDEGCLVISQFTDTVGPAVACEEFFDHEVYHVGYNIDMTDVAPHTSLTSCRIDWIPYLSGAVEAMRTNSPIEETVQGRTHPKNDMSDGLAQGWVKLTPLNEALLPVDTQEQVDEVSAQVADGSRQVFFGDYKGVNPEDPNDVIDLSTPFIENRDSSIPSFHYLLDDVVKIEE